VQLPGEDRGLVLRVGIEELGDADARAEDERAGESDDDGDADEGLLQVNAWIPVMARPRISAWMSCVPS
jgi:hypothetical protein